MTFTGQAQEGVQQTEGCQTVLYLVLPMLAAQPRLSEALHLRLPCGQVKDLLPANCLTQMSRIEPQMSGNEPKMSGNRA